MLFVVKYNSPILIFLFLELLIPVHPFKHLFFYSQNLQLFLNFSKILLLVILRSKTRFPPVPSYSFASNYYRNKSVMMFLSV